MAIGLYPQASSQYTAKAQARIVGAVLNKSLSQAIVRIGMASNTCTNSVIHHRRASMASILSKISH